VKIPLRCYGTKPQSFYNISPNGGLPAIIIRGTKMTESNDIMFALESLFPEKNPLFPNQKVNPKLYQRAQSLLQLEVSCNNNNNKNSTV
jgi:glutathione S-transferase